MSLESKITERLLPVGKHLLLVSDLHLHDEASPGYFSFESCSKAVDMLIALVERETPDEVWILGDLFHLSVHQMNYPLAQLEVLQSAIHAHIVVMTGNHDAVILQKIAQQFSADRLEIIVSPFVKLCHEAGTISQEDSEREIIPILERDAELTTASTIWLTHDGDNPIWLSEAQCFPYLRDIRVRWKIPQTEILLSCHTHRVLVKEEGKTRSLGVWNIPGHGDNLWYTYAQIVTRKTELQIKFCHLTPD